MSRHTTHATTSRSSPTSFRRWLKRYDYRRPRRGQVMTGQVVQVDPDVVLVDVGRKYDAEVPRHDAEAAASEADLSLRPGHEVPVYVVRPPTRFLSRLQASIWRALQERDWRRAEQALEEGCILEVRVRGENRGGLLASFGRLEGFIPNSHLPGLRSTLSGTERRRMKRKYLGDQLPVKVIEVNRRRERLVLSPRAARRELGPQQLQELQAGDRLQGRVVNLVEFGAFVDLGGVDGLIHISELDWSHVEHPSQVLELGDTVEVEVLAVDVARGRISLSRRRLLPNPWPQIARQYQPGDIVEVEIDRLEEGRLLVRLPEGPRVPIAWQPGTTPELCQAGSPPRPGDRVLVRVDDLEAARGRVHLTLCPGDTADARRNDAQTGSHGGPSEHQ